MIRSIIFCVILALATSTIEKGYTIISPRQYRNQYFGANDNTTHVIIGNYLDQKGNIDAIRVSENSYQFNINLNEALRGKTKYYKVFGSAQNYNNILLVNSQSIAAGIKRNNAMKGSNIIIDWDHKLLDVQSQDQQLKYVQWLKDFLTAIPNAILKIPAHFLCKTIKQIAFHKHLNHKAYIIELYGSDNPYLTYQSIFTNNVYQNESNGYTAQCPKNPSTLKLKAILQNTTFNIQKSLNTQNKGYVGEMNEWITKAGTQNAFSGVVFFDQHPRNMFKL